MDGGSSCPPIFWPLKNGPRNFSLCSDKPPRDILGPLSQYDPPWKENKIIVTYP